MGTLGRLSCVTGLGAVVNFERALLGDTSLLNPGVDMSRMCVDHTRGSEPARTIVRTTRSVRYKITVFRVSDPFQSGGRRHTEASVQPGEAHQNSVGCASFVPEDVAPCVPSEPSDTGRNKASSYRGYYRVVVNGR